jgi:hypothetical protein
MRSCRVLAVQYAAECRRQGSRFHRNRNKRLQVGGTSRCSRFWGAPARLARCSWRRASPLPKRGAARARRAERAWDRVRWPALSEERAAPPRTRADTGAGEMPPGRATDTGQGALQDMQGTCDLCGEDAYPSEEARRLHGVCACAGSDLGAGEAAAKPGRAPGPDTTPPRAACPPSSGPSPLQSCIHPNPPPVL